MNDAQKILMIMGAGFTAVGTIVTIVFVGVGDIGVFLVIPVFFILLGICFIVGVFVSLANKKKIQTQGRRFPAKIYGYVDNTSYTVNNNFTVNVKVHYFDERHIEREAILPTSFPKGSGMYPIGMTIDIFEYQGQYSFDPNSVRNERLLGEEELMDDKPVAPEQLQLVAVTCPYCGSHFQAAAGYSSKCPYCNGYINV